MGKNRVSPMVNGETESVGLGGVPEGQPPSTQGVPESSGRDAHGDKGAGRSGGRGGNPRQPGIDEQDRLRELVASFGLEESRSVASDVAAMEKWPMLWACMSCQKDRQGDPRAPGELRIEAQGQSFITKLILPEEGIEVHAAGEYLSDAFDAIEGSLCVRPVPWRKCSQYALKKRANRKKKVDK
jgi:hypothetical protein